MSNEQNAMTIESCAAEQLKDREALKTFGLALNDSLIKIEKGAQNIQVSIISLAAVIASLPETADVDPRRVGAAISAIVLGKPNAKELTQHSALFAAQILEAAKSARSFLERASQAEAAGEAPSPQPRPN